VWLLLIPFLLLLGACSSPPPVDLAIPGLDQGDIAYALADKGMVNAGQSGHGTWRTTHKAFMGGIDYNVEAVGRDPEAVDSVRVVITSDSTLGNVFASQPFVRDIAMARYDDCDPERVRQWLDEHFHDSESRIVVGPAEFTLYAPSDYRRELIIRRALP